MIFKLLRIKDVLGKRDCILMFVDAEPEAINLALKYGNKVMHITEKQYYKLTNEGE